MKLTKFNNYNKIKLGHLQPDDILYKINCAQQEEGEQKIYLWEAHFC